MSNVVIAFLGIGFMFLMSVLGAGVVFLFKKEISGKMNSIFLGFASGIMISSAIWSLLVPAIEGSSSLGRLDFLPAAGGMLLGTIFLVVMDKFVPKILDRKSKNKHKGLSKTAKLFLAITIHNVPEGLAAGLAIGNAFVLGGGSAAYSALWLAIGLGLQNLPESSAISLPLKEKLKSNKKAFWYSVLSGAIEPIMAVIGIFISTALSGIMPWLLAFAAGCMLFVVAEELIPEAKLSSRESNIGSWALIVGFVVMMILDIAFA